MITRAMAHIKRLFLGGLKCTGIGILAAVGIVWVAFIATGGVCLFLSWIGVL